MHTREKSCRKTIAILRNFKKIAKLISTFQANSRHSIDSNTLQEFPGTCGNQIHTLKLKESQDTEPRFDLFFPKSYY